MRTTRWSRAPSGVRVGGWAAVYVAAMIAGPTAALAAGSPVADAAGEADFARLRALIASGEDVNAPAADGSTALLWAAYHSDPDAIGALITAGADVDRPNAFGVTPLFQASRIGDAPVIAALLEGGADPALAHPDGVTPLMAAARTGRVDAIRLLLEHGADPNAADEYQHQTALMWAAAEGHLDAVGLLLDAGADPNAQARVSELTERSINADFPTGGFTALMWAARNGYEDVVERLIDGGADPDLTNGDDATALMIAIVNDRYDMAAKLLELGTGVDDGSLYYAAEMRDATTDWFAKDGSRLRPDHSNERTALDLIALLLEAGADPNRPFVGQMHSYSMCCDIRANGSAFYRAAVAADVEALKLMAAHGADLEWSPEAPPGPGAGPGGNASAGRPPIVAAMNGGRGVGRAGGPGDLREGPPPFREPSNREPADAVQVLLDAGANPNARLANGNTPLHEAVRARRLEIIERLTAAGADPMAENEEGETPLAMAEAMPERGGRPGPPGPAGPGAGGGERASKDDIIAALQNAVAAREQNL